MPNVVEFDRLVSYFTADLSSLEAGVKKGERLVSGFERKLKSLKGSLQVDLNASSATKSLGGADTAMRRAQADIARMQRQTAAGEAALTRQITREAEQQYRAKTRAYQRAVQDHLRYSRQMAAIEARNSGEGVLATAGAGAGRILGGIGVTGTAIAYGIGRSAIEIDNLQNSLNAATGSIEKGQAKLQALNDVAAASPGVLLSTASSTYALLQPMGLAEKTIDRLTGAFGRIKLARPSADMTTFAFNLNQIASTLEKEDFKEALNNFPRFGEIVKKAFNLKSAKDDIEGLLGELRKLKTAGKLSKEAWFTGIAEAVNSDASLGKLQDTISVKFEKLTDQLKLRVAPLGHAVLDTFLAGLMPTNDTQGGLSDFGNAISTQILTLYAKAGNKLGAVSDAYYDELISKISEKNKAAKVRILQKTKAEWEGVLAAPFSDASAIAEAKKQIESTDKKLQIVLFGDRTPDQDAVTLSMGATFGKLFTKGVQKGIETTKADVAKAASSLFLADGSHQVRMALIDAAPTSNGSRQSQQNSEQERYLREQIGLQKKYFSEKLRLSASDGESDQETAKERFETISKLEADLRVQRIKSQKDLRELERQNTEQSRRDLTDFKNIELRSVSDRLNARTRLIEDQIEKEGGMNAGHFTELIAATQQGYQEISRLTAENYDLQLQDETLTAQQRVNILRQRFEEEAALHEANARNVAEIEKRQYQEQIRQVNMAAQRTAAIFRNSADLYGSVGGAMSGSSVDKSLVGAIGIAFFGGDPDAQVKAVKDRIATLEAIKKTVVDSWSKDHARTPEATAKAFRAMAQIDEPLKEQEGFLQKLVERHKANELAIYKTVQAYEAGTASIEAYQQAQLDLFDIQHEANYSEFQSRAKAVGYQLSEAKRKGNQDDINQFESEYNSILAEQTRFILGNAIARKAMADASNAGLQATLQQLKIGDPAKIRTLTDGFRGEHLKEEVDLRTRLLELKIRDGNESLRQIAFEVELQNGRNEISELRFRSTRTEELRALELEKAAINDLIALEQARTQVLIESQRTVQYRMAMQVAQLPTYQAQFEGFFANLPTTLSDVWGQTLQNFDGTWSGFLTTLKENFARTVQEMLAELIRAQLIRGLVGLFGGLLGGFAGPVATGAGGAMTNANVMSWLGNIPGKAAGGPVSAGQMYQVNENGPELFVSGQNGYILNNKDSKELLSGAGRNGGGTVIINNHFHADRQTGAFSKPSAQQAARAFGDQIKSERR